MTDQMQVILWLMPLAAAAGAVVRLLCDWYLPQKGILVANLAGSFLAGTAAMVLSIGPQSAPSLAVGGTSVLPAALILLLAFTTALTTFSTVSVRTAQRVWDRDWAGAARMWLAHLGGGLAAAVCGALLAWVLLGI